ncbi:MAG: hypothetical protein LKF52_06820 [Butyrivibrio sp.]|jgi:hypothetical protein|nr:hypothetical protein [Butyrivibrio sp.]
MRNEMDRNKVINKHIKPFFLRKYRKISISEMIISLMVILCSLPQELTLKSYSDSYTRQYGSSYTITISMVLVVCLIIARNGHIKKYKYTIKSPFIAFILFGVFSICFKPFNGVPIAFYGIAACKYLAYGLMFIVLTNCVTYHRFLEGFDLGAKAGLIFQSIIGWLYVFAGVEVPVIGGHSNSVRNGLSRMVGTFQHPGDFSLYIGILFVYFLCRIIITGEKKKLIYLFIAFLDIFLSGARTMLLVTSIVAVIVLYKKYRRSSFAKVAIFAVIVFVVVLFLQSDIYQDMFVRHNVYDMLVARTIHWILGFKIMTESISNFLFGIGMNNIVHYIDENYTRYAALVALASNVLDSDFVRGMPIHNSFLIIGCELGIGGFTLYIWIYIWYTRQLLQIMRKSIASKFDCFFIIADFGVFILYSFQGWAMMKNFAWTLFILIISFATLVIRENKKSRFMFTCDRNDK